MYPKYSGIYKITNLVNGKVYIGQAKNIYLRWLEHKCRLRNNYNDCEYLQRAWNKYKEENFKFSVLEECSIEELNRKEHYWCVLLNSHNKEKGYNIRPTDENGKYLVSDDTKQKLSKINKGRKFLESRNIKISISKKGKPRDEETKRKLSEYWKNRYKEGLVINPMSGKRHSQETINKMSNIKIGKVGGMKGRKHSEETKNKMRKPKQKTIQK
jgi:hypothetical protein